jgi:hypothetical protein
MHTFNLVAYLIIHFNFISHIFQVKQLFAERGPSVLFVDRLDDAAPEVRRGYSRITDVIASQVTIN